ASMSHYGCDRLTCACVPYLSLAWIPALPPAACGQDTAAIRTERRVVHPLARDHWRRECNSAQGIPHSRRVIPTPCPDAVSARAKRRLNDHIVVHQRPGNNCPRPRIPNSRRTISAGGNDIATVATKRCVVYGHPMNHRHGYWRTCLRTPHTRRTILTRRDD